MAPRVPKPGESLADLFPEVAAEWHPTKNEGLAPSDVAQFSWRKVWWLSPCGHEFDMAVADRSRGRKCPYCRGLRVLAGDNDLATLHSGIAAEWHPTKNEGLMPSQVTRSSNKKVWWLCAEGHEFQQIIQSRTDQKHGCPFCAGQKALRGQNDLATTNPTLAAQWHPTRNGDLTPFDVLQFTNKRVWWLGPCGHEFDLKISDRSSQNQNCPFCAGRRVLAGFNDLVAVFPALATEWHPTKNGALSPSDVTPGQHKKVWWLGSCGHEWRASINNRTRDGGSGCPFCAERGYTPDERGWLYLMRHDGWRLLQIGKTNHPDQRLAQHGRGGWEVVDVRGPIDGQACSDLERAALAAVKRRGALLANARGHEGFSGYTEAWPTESLQLSTLDQLIGWINDDEELGL